MSGGPPFDTRDPVPAVVDEPVAFESEYAPCAPAVGLPRASMPAWAPAVSVLSKLGGDAVFWAARESSVRAWIVATLPAWVWLPSMVVVPVEREVTLPRAVMLLVTASVDDWV